MRKLRPSRRQPVANTRTPTPESVGGAWYTHGAGMQSGVTRNSELTTSPGAREFRVNPVPQTFCALHQRTKNLSADYLSCVDGRSQAISAMHVNSSYPVRMIEIDWGVNLSALARWYRAPR